MWAQQMMGPMGGAKGGMPCMGGMGPPLGGMAPMWNSGPAFGGGFGGQPWGNGGKGGKWGKGDSWPSQEAYVESRLRQSDFNGYKSAGIVMYRKGDNGVELLLSVEKPWNAIREDYDPLSWNILGGKRGGAVAKAGKETAPQMTVARCLLDVFGPVENCPAAKDLRRLARTSPCLWYPRGKYALFLREVKGDDAGLVAELPERYAAAKEQGLVPAKPPEDEEPRLNPVTGAPLTKWVKQVEELEWVPVADLLSDPTKRPLADLLKNVVEVSTFKKFLQGESLPAGPPPPSDADDENKGGDKGEKSGGKSKGKGKQGKGWKGAGPSYGGGCGMGCYGGYDGFGGGKKGKGYGKGGGMPPPMMQPLPPQMLMQMAPMAPDPEVQKQFVGERVYVLVNALLKDDFTAQKVTGMLLELPEPELNPLLEQTSEGQAALKARVDEAMDVLKQDKFID